MLISLNGRREYVSGRAIEYAVTLAKLDIRRTLIPYARSLIVVAIVLFFAATANRPRPDLFWMAFTVLLLLGMMQVPTLMDRDRNVGNLVYLGSLPCSGMVLMSVRCAVITFYNLLSVALTLTLMATFSDRVFVNGIPTTTIVVGAFVSLVALTLVGIIVTGPLTKFQMSRVLGVPMMVLIFSSFIYERLGDPLRLAERVTSWVGGAPNMSLTVVGIALLVLTGCACVSFVYAMRKLQPRIGSPTGDAIAFLERYEMGDYDI